VITIFYKCAAQLFEHIFEHTVTAIRAVACFVPIGR
jgi:hypothetical protein